MWPVVCGTCSAGMATPFSSRQHWVYIQETVLVINPFVFAGILKLFQSSLLGFRSIEDMGQFLGKLPPTMDSDTLFAQIDSIHFTSKRFKQILAQQHSGHVSDSTTA